MDITTIIPIHDYNDENASLLTKAIESIAEQKDVTEKPNVLVVYAPTIEKEMLSFKEEITKNDENKLNIEFVKNDGNTNFQGQMNFGVKQIKTNYFSILEFDDEYGTVYLKNGKKYMDAYPEVDVFLPMIIEINDKDEGLKLTNVVTWSKEFVGENGEMGYLALDMLKQYTDFKVCGAIIKKSEYENIGGFKTKLELTSTYEFLLRAINSGLKVMTMPKISYKHLTSREDSLFSHYSKNMSMPERKFWFDTANVEYNFTNDRDIDLTKLKKILEPQK